MTEEKSFTLEGGRKQSEASGRVHTEHGQLQTGAMKGGREGERQRG